MKKKSLGKKNTSAQKRSDKNLIQFTKGLIVMLEQNSFYNHVFLLCIEKVKLLFKHYDSLKQYVVE